VKDLPHPVFPKKQIELSAESPWQDLTRKLKGAKHTDEAAMVPSHPIAWRQACEKVPISVLSPPVLMEGIESDLTPGPLGVGQLSVNSGYVLCNMDRRPTNRYRNSHRSLVIGMC
jgi:hypothetical protein